MIRAVLGSVFFVWAVVAVFRLMRSELQYRAWPWFWTLFIGFCATLAAGISKSGYGSYLLRLASDLAL